MPRVHTPVPSQSLQGCAQMAVVAVLLYIAAALASVCAGGVGGSALALAAAALFLSPSLI